MRSFNVRIRSQSLFIIALFFCLLSFAAAAKAANRSSLPKVGTIKDYPATGLMTGCGNLYFYKATSVGNPTVREGAVPEGILPDGRVSATTANSTSANYVFLSRGDGGNAWMNLNGRDARLLQIKSGVRANPKLRGYIYRFGGVRITVEIEDYAAQGANGEGDHMFKMKITLRRGRAVRVVRAVGSADC